MGRRRKRQKLDEPDRRPATQAAEPEVSSTGDEAGETGGTDPRELDPAELLAVDDAATQPEGAAATSLQRSTMSAVGGEPSPPPAASRAQRKYGKREVILLDSEDDEDPGSAAAFPVAMRDQRPRAAEPASPLSPRVRAACAPDPEQPRAFVHESRRSVSKKIRDRCGCCAGSFAAAQRPCDVCRLFLLSENPTLHLACVGPPGTGKTTFVKQLALPSSADVPNATLHHMPGPSGLGASQKTELLAVTLTYARPEERARLVLCPGTADGGKPREMRSPEHLTPLESLVWLRDSLATAQAERSGSRPKWSTAELFFCWGTGPGVTVSDTRGFTEAEARQKLPAKEANAIFLFGSRAGTEATFKTMFEQVDCDWDTEPIIVSVYSAPKHKEPEKAREEAEKAMKSDALASLRAHPNVLPSVRLADRRQRIFTRLAEGARLYGYQHLENGDTQYEQWRQQFKGLLDEMRGVISDRYWRAYARRASTYARAVHKRLGKSASRKGRGPYFPRKKSQAEAERQAQAMVTEWERKLAKKLLSYMRGRWRSGGRPSLTGEDRTLLRNITRGLVDDLVATLVAKLEFELLKVLDKVESHGKSKESKKRSRERNMLELEQHTDLQVFTDRAVALLSEWATRAKSDARVDALVDAVAQAVENAERA